MFYLLEHGWLFGVKKFKEKESVVIEDSGFPYGWNKGDTCVMITNKTKKYLRIYGREL